MAKRSVTKLEEVSCCGVLMFWWGAEVRPTCRKSAPTPEETPEGMCAVVTGSEGKGARPDLESYVMRMGHEGCDEWQRRVSTLTQTDLHIHAMRLAPRRSSFSTRMSSARSQLLHEALFQRTHPQSLSLSAAVLGSKQVSPVDYPSL